jgi:EAL domain-containing protein (putative c-di-GMP-specific phosphodiesterase class I)
MEHGCDRIQGYLISKPLHENDALEFLKKQEQTGRKGD